MPVVFVHGVANRPSAEQAAETAQRDALFRAITFRDDAILVCNPNWGSNAVSFTERWLPNPDSIQAFAMGDGHPSTGDLGLGRIAKFDGAQAVDLAILAALEEAIVNDGRGGLGASASTDKDLLKLARTAADYLAVPAATNNPIGIASLEAGSDQDFVEALDAELALFDKSDMQAFGIGDKLRGAVNALGGWIGNSASDAVLRAKRQSLSRGVALFLGDILVYLRNRDIAGPTGTEARLFEPIMLGLIEAATAPRKEKEPFVVIGLVFSCDWCGLRTESVLRANRCNAEHC